MDHITDTDCAAAIETVRAWLSQNDVWGCHIYIINCARLSFQHRESIRSEPASAAITEYRRRRET